MYKTGLTSITFRQHTINEVVDLARGAQLDAIEWGGDVHAPPGDLDAAKKARQATAKAGLSISSYGSYYRCEDDEDFAPVLESALALGAPVIRVWAGKLSPDEADAAYRASVIENLRSAVEAATAKGVTIGLEYHGNTLTETQASAHELLSEVGLSALKLYWQPRTCGEFTEDLVELEAALPHLSHIHAFHWGKEGWKDRKAFAEGTADWKQYLQLAQKANGDRYVIFEFVRNDDPAQLVPDAAALHQLLSEIQ